MSKTNPIVRLLPLIIILAVAILGVVYLRDDLTFDALAANREALILLLLASISLSLGSLCRERRLRHLLAGFYSAPFPAYSTIC